MHHGRSSGTWREWLNRVAGLFQRGRSDEDLAEELRSHLELAAEQSRPHAHPDAEPLRATVVRHGAVAASMEPLRDQRGFRWFADVTRDLRHSMRALRRTPTFAATALLTLAIGIGANTAVFSIVNSVLLQPLPYPDADRVVAVWHTAPGAPGLSSFSSGLRLSSSMYITYAEENRAFTAFGLWSPRLTTVTGLAEPEQARTVVITDGTLQALGVEPQLGRWLDPLEFQPGRPDVVMLGHGYWQRRFGGARDVVGRTLIVDGTSREIVGVMPQGFRIVKEDPELLLPLRFERGQQRLAGFGFQAVARLEPGVTIAAANQDVARMVDIWMRAWPAAPGIDPLVYEAWKIAPDIRPLKADVVGNITGDLWLLMGSILVVLVIACANVASLLLVRAESRQHELAVRAALGAGRGRIVRSQLVESVGLGVGGGICGVGLAYVGIQLLVAHGPSTLPRLHEIAVDPRALGFAVLISILSGLVLGLVPISRYGGEELSMRLRSAGRTASAGADRQRTRNALVVAQVALAFVLLVCSGLMMRTFQSLRAVQPGFESAGVQTMRIAFPAATIPDPEHATRVQQQIADAVARIPGVTAVGFASVMPMEGVPPDWDAVFPEGTPLTSGDSVAFRLFKAVSPGYFHAAGTRIIAGRDFTWTDLYDRRPAIIVSDNLAREFWGSAGAALGKRVRTRPNAPWREVVGVVENVHDSGVHAAPPAAVYWPTLKESPYRVGTDVARNVAFAIRTDLAGTEGLANELRHAVWSVNANLPLASIQTMQQIYDRSMARTSFTLVMLGLAGTMALTLGIIGIYGVISYTVSQRTREIGIRLALGAQRGPLERMFVWRGVALAGVGMLIGVVAARLTTDGMSSLLYGVEPLDPVTYLVVPFVLILSAAAASYIPARRAATVDPVDALKSE